MSIFSQIVRGVFSVFSPSVPTIPEVVSHIDLQQQLESDYNVPVCYGEVGLSGNLIFYNTTGDDNKYLDIVVLVSEGEIEGFTKVFMDDDSLPLFDAGVGNTLTSETELESTNPLFGAIAADGSHTFGINFNTVRDTDWINFFDAAGNKAVFTAGTDFTVGATLSDSVTNLVTALNASSDSVISKATYTELSTGDGLSVSYDIAGNDGNAFRIKSEIVVLTPGDYGGTVRGYVRNDTTLSGGRSASYVNAYFYNGTDAQAANAQLITAYPPVTDETTGWTSNHTLSGFSYMYVRLLNNIDLFSGSIPQFKFELKGNKVYDSRLDATNGGSGTHREDDSSTWEYSDNPALCTRDYITNGRYGKDLTSSAVNISSIAASADDCDTLKDGLDLVGDPITYKTYTLGAVVDTSMKVKDNTNLFLQTMNGALPYFDGQYSLNVLQAGNATVFLNEDNIVGSVSLTAPSKNDRFNKVWVTFPDKDFHFESGDAPKDSSTYLSEDNDQVLEKRIDAPYVNYYPQAMDLAELTMNLSRRGNGVSFTTTMGVLEETAGGIAGFTYSPFGYTDKEFRIEKILIRTDGLCDVELSEHDDSFYTLSTQQEQDTSNSTSLIDPREVLKPTITSVLSDGTTALVSVDGVATPRIYVEWVNNDAYPNTYLIYSKKSSEGSFTEVGQVNAGNVLSFYIPNIEWGESYDVGVAVRNGAGYVSPIAVGTVPADNPIANPTYTYPNVSGLELIGAGTDQGQGNSEEFTGQDIRIQWRLSSDNVAFEYGSDESEAAGSVGGVMPFTLNGYRIEIFHSGDTEARQEYFVTDPSFTYTYDKNFEDGEGAASRSVNFKIWAVGSVTGIGSTGESESPALLSATNPQPALPTGVSVTGGFQHIDLSFTTPNDNDYAGVKVWLSTSTGFTPSDSTLVYSGPDNKIQISGLETGTDYYLVFAPFDGFGTSGITQSSEYAVTTQAIISADLDTTAPTIPGSLLLTSSVQESKLYVKSSITATWTASTDDGILSGYSVQYWDDVDSTTIEAFTTALEYVITDAVVGRTYSVRVKAKDWASNESAWTTTETQVAAGDTSAVTNVTGHTATAGLKKVILDWTNPSGAGYLTTNIYRGTSTGSYGSTPIYVGMGDVFVDNDVDTGTEYFYVLSTNSVSQVESSESTEISATPDTITAANATEYIAAAAIDADRIVANSITANEIDANTITGNEITGTTLSAIYADLGTVTAGTINGLTIQTSATAPTTGGVTMTSTGVKGFNTSGTITSHIKTDGTGFLGLTNPISWDASGVVTVPGTIIAGEIVGNTIKTDTTGYRVEMTSAAPFTYWNGTTTLVELDSAGNASFSGSVTIGSGSSGIATFSDAGGLATQDRVDLDYTDGADVTEDNTAGSGVNIINPLYSDFEGSLPPISGSSGTAGISSVSFYSDKSLSTTAGAVNDTFWFGSSTTDYNQKLEPNKKWIFSARVRSTATSAIGRLYIKSSAGIFYSELFTTSATANTWTLVSVVLDMSLDASSSGIVIVGNITNGNTILLDGMQIEDQVGTLTTPSAYSAPGDTTQYALEADLTVASGGIEISETASIRAGKTSASDTTAGFWLGYDGVTSGKYDFHIGDASSYLWWDHSAATLKITGQLLASQFQTAVSGQRIDINPSGDNEVHFYGDRGDTTVEELATIGIKSAGGDNNILVTGSVDSDHRGILTRSTNTGILGISYGGAYNLSAGVHAEATEKACALKVRTFGAADSATLGFPVFIQDESTGYTGGQLRFTKQSKYVTGTPTHNPGVYAAFLVNVDGDLFWNVGNTSTWTKLN